MKRFLPAAVVIAVLGTLVAAMVSAPGPRTEHYWVTLDNAFGLVPGGDVKIAGVRAGEIKSFAIQPHTDKALVEVEITRTGFGLRRDAFCESRPQSLIGEYFLDCQPGHSAQALPQGGTLPVTRSGSTVPFDLLNNDLRLPYRQRLTVFLNDIGAGLAARGPQLSATIRRAVPALREFDQVLGILAQQNHTVADLQQQADSVVTALARNRRDVARWVVQSARSAQASADQQAALAQTFKRFPAFLEELTPTMRSLATVTTHQSPALRFLYANAPGLDRFLSDLGPFANASRPAVRALGQQSKVGSQAIGPARPVVALLRRIGFHLPETSRDLAIVLRDLDNPARATERDPRSPGGRGFTGLEALLQYVRNQSLVINSFDQYGYVLRADAFVNNNCGPYRDGADVRAHYNQLKSCFSILGPHQPGINEPDPTAPGGSASSASAGGSPSAASSGGSASSAATPTDNPQSMSSLLRYLLAK